MKNLLAKQTRFSYAAAAGALLCLLAFIVYLINSTTGYLAGTALDPLVILFSLLAFACGLAMFLLGEKLGRFAGFGYLAMGVFLSLSIAALILSRQQIVADIYFIPVNHPVAEEATFGGSVAALLLYLLAFLAAVYATFGEKPFKQSKAEA